MDAADVNTGAPAGEDARQESPAAVASASSAANEPGTPGQRCSPGRVIYLQARIDALAGCEVVSGDLYISFATADLRPLHALRRVEGNLVLVGRDYYDDGSGISSLEGLEQLEEVTGGVTLRHLTATTLAPLGNLRQVGDPDEIGGIGLGTLHGLESLDGLQNLDLARMSLDLQDNASLETLEPLVFPRDMRGSLSLLSNPRLASLGDFGAVETMDRLYLNHTALTQLDALSSLRSVQVLDISSNPELMDVRGLAGLESAEWLGLDDNPKLRAVPDFARLVHAGRISVTQSDALAVFPSFPQLVELSGVWAGRLIVEDNSGLVDISGLDSLRSADSVSIRRNASLEGSVLPALADVSEELVITSNPALDEASITRLAGIAAARVKLAGNGPDAAVADPCPWTSDGECDAAPGEVLCAPETDEDDCEASSSQ